VRKFSQLHGQRGSVGRCRETCSRTNLSLTRGRAGACQPSRVAVCQLPPYACNAWRNRRRRGVKFRILQFLSLCSDSQYRAAIAAKCTHPMGSSRPIQQNTTRTQLSLILLKVILTSHPIRVNSPALARHRLSKGGQLAFRSIFFSGHVFSFGKPPPLFSRQSQLRKSRTRSSPHTHTHLNTS
jgi:hypothetical protein